MSHVAVDPRIRARRIAVRRSEGRQRLRRLLILGGVLGLLAALAGAAFSPLLDVDAVRVAGAARSGDDAVLAAAGVRSGEAMVAVDAGNVERAVETLPWVADATVARRWPGTVRIDVRERTPVAAVGEGNEWVVVDADGQVLERTGQAPDLPILEGVDGDAAAGARLDAAGPLAVVTALPSALDGRVREVRAGRGLELVVLLPDGEEAVAVLGSADDLGAKLLSLTTVLDQVDPAGLDRIDVRVADAPVLTRR